MSDYLNRYTDIPSLLYILKSKKITLLNPEGWVDKNDVHYMFQYKAKRGLTTLLALCFSEAAETYHHWHVFSSGPSGVRIEYDRTKLLEAVKSVKGVRCKKVQYKLINDGAKEASPKINNLPFIKRVGYGPEEEYRVIFESKTENLLKKEIDIDLSCIRRITLSPWLHDDLVPVIRGVIRGIVGKDVVQKVVKTTLISNNRWKEYCDRAV